MYYVVSFGDCHLDGPLKSRSAIAALALAEEAEKAGCPDLIITTPDGSVLTLGDFAALHRLGR